MPRVAHIQPNAPGGKPPETGYIHHFQLLQRSVFGVQCSVFIPLQRSVFGVQCSVFNPLQRSLIGVPCSVLSSRTNNSNPEPNWYIYHSDHLGSSSFQTDASGTPTQHLQYMPFGENFVEQRSITSYYTPYTFSAKERDLETGYSYFGARYYDADISVWLSVDPMADKYPSMSAYMYCAGNPVMLVDHFGLEPEEIENGGVKRLFRKIGNWLKGNGWTDPNDFYQYKLNNGDTYIVKYLNPVVIRSDGSEGEFDATSRPFPGSGMTKFEVPGSLLWVSTAKLVGITWKGIKNVFVKGGVRNAVSKGGIQLSKRMFGHTFTRHGDDMTNFLLKRARGSGIPQGQFLNNQQAAQFIKENLSKTANGPINIPIPKNFPARVIMPNGSFQVPTHIRLVPGGGGVKTAYPIIL